jgi:hypothetical protein
MDIDNVKSHKWHGSKEKKWSWYKHTKPCNNILHSGTCTVPFCNYAHTVEEYTTACQKRHFTLDTSILNQLYLATLPVESNKHKRSYETYNEPSAKKQKIEY